MPSFICLPFLSFVSFLKHFHIQICWNTHMPSLPFTQTCFSTTSMGLGANICLMKIKENILLNYEVQPKYSLSIIVIHIPKSWNVLLVHCLFLENQDLVILAFMDSNNYNKINYPFKAVLHCQCHSAMILYVLALFELLLTWSPPGQRLNIMNAVSW